MDISNNRLMHAGRLAPVVTVSVANSPDTSVLSHQHDLAISIVSTLVEQMGWRILHGRQTGVQSSGKTGVNSAMRPRAAKNSAVHCFTNAQHLRTYESEGRRLHLLGPTVLTRPGTEPLTPTHGNNPWWDLTELSKPLSFNQRTTPATDHHLNLWGFCQSFVLSLAPGTQSGNLPLKEPSTILGAPWPKKRSEQGSIDMMCCQSPGNQ
jgi:hypothetical protein